MFSDEQAKAVQEVAKSTGPVIKAAQKLGAYLDGIFGETFRQIGGIAGDYAQYYRLVNLLRIADQVQRIQKERQAAGKPTPIPPSFVLPLLEGASLESEPDIQTLWAALIANATDPARTTASGSHGIHGIGVRTCILLFTSHSTIRAL